MLDGMETGLLSFDRALTILVVNDSLGPVLGIPAPGTGCCATVLPLLEASTVLAGLGARRVHEACLTAIADTRAASSFTLSSACGQRVFTARLSRIGDDQWMASFEEITARRDAEASARQAAMRDSLTGLCSRALFQEQVTAVLADGGEDLPGAAVMLIDLDRFKAVNDTLGHPIGDALLCLVGKRLHSVMRHEDVIARLGGDEFAILVSPNVARADMAGLAGRVGDVLGRPYLVDGHWVNVSASIGVAVSPRDGRDYDQLLKNADLALYAAKAAGRGTHGFFEPAMDARALGRVENQGIPLPTASVVQALKGVCHGPVQPDGRAMGEDGAFLPG